MSKFIPSGSMTRDVGKVRLRRPRAEPEWDLMVATDAHHASFWLRKLHKPFDYKSLGVDEKLIDHDGGSISFSTSTSSPPITQFGFRERCAEELGTLPPTKVERQGGRDQATHHLGRLAVGPWGEEKTTAYVKSLAQQDPIVGELGPTYTRLQLGEILVALSLTDSYIYPAEQTGAPIAEASEVQPVIAPSYHVGVLKGAQHPNAAHLFALFMTMPESQQVWERAVGVSSALIPGTTYYQKAKGKQLIFMRKEQSEKVESLAKSYGKIIGIL